MTKPLALTNPLPYGLDAQSKRADFWPTPPSAVLPLLANYPPPHGIRILEPCAGNGAIVRVLQGAGYEVVANELRDEEIAGLQNLCPTTRGDFLANFLDFKGTRSIVTNPPFSLAVEFAACCLALLPQYLALLLRCNMLGSATWAGLWTKSPPTALRTLRRRPSFSGDGRTDASEYMWAIWDSTRTPLDIKPI